MMLTANYLRATLYQAGGKSAQAAIHLEKAVIRRPEFEFAYRELVIALSMGRIADAICWCDRALERLPDSAELHFYRRNCINTLMQRMRRLRVREWR